MIVINRVLILLIVDGLPVVSGADSVVEQGDGWYHAYAPEGPAPEGAHNATCNPTIADLYEDAPGRFVMFGIKAVLDKIGAGPALKDYTGDWSHYRVDGDEPNTGPGAATRVPVIDRVMVLEEKPPADVSESKPLMIGDARITEIKKSIASTMMGVNLKDLAENKAEAIPL